MPQISVEYNILYNLSKYYEDNISKRVIDKLISFNDKQMLLSGEDSGLKTVWEEICVQVQNEYSYNWNVYEETIENIIGDEFDDLPSPIKDLMLTLVAEDSQDLYSFREVIITDIKDTVLSSAADYSNSRIEKAIAGDDWGDEDEEDEEEEFEDEEDEEEEEFEK